MPTLLAVIYANTVNGTGCRTGSVGDGITADIIASDSDCIFGRDKAKLTGQGQGQSQGIGQGQGLDLSPARLQYVRAYVKCLDSQRVKFGVANGEGVGVSEGGGVNVSVSGNDNQAVVLQQLCSLSQRLPMCLWRSDLLE